MTGAVAQKLYQAVASAVVDQIREGRYPAGERLPSERELVTEFGVSRPTIREAMIALEVMGMVHSRPGAGVYVVDAIPVTTPSTDLDIGAFELTEARIFFEGEAAALAASSITDAELSELRHILELMEAENSGPGGRERCDRQFHIAVAQASHNEAVVKVVNYLWDMRDHSCLHTVTQSRARDSGLQPRIAEHELILDALTKRDPQQARAAMRDHLSRVIEGLLVATEVEVIERARHEKHARLRKFNQRLSV